MEKTKNNNLWLMVFITFFVSLSYALFEFFLPFYLKQEGFSILEIGFLFSVGLALGSFFVSILYSKILKSIRTKSGFFLSGIITFFVSFLFFLHPSNLIALISNFIFKVENSIRSVTLDAGFFHNISKENSGKFSSLSFMFSSLGILIGILLSIYLINLIGFRYSFLVFSLAAIPILFLAFFYSDKTRFRPKGLKKIQFNKNLTKIIVIENLFWLGMTSSFAIVITFLVQDYLGGGIGSLALVFLALYISLIFSSFISSRVSDRLNKFKLAAFGMFLIFLGAIVMVFSKNVFLAAVSLFLEGIGAGFWGPAHYSIYAANVPREKREDVAGVRSGILHFSKSLGPFLGSLIVVSLGIRAPFIFRTVICAIVIIFYLKLNHSLKKNKNQNP